MIRLLNNTVVAVLSILVPLAQAIKVKYAVITV